MGQIISMKPSHDDVIELADAIENCAEWMGDIIELLEKSHDPSYRKALELARTAQAAVQSVSGPVQPLIKRARAKEAREDAAFEKRREQNYVELWD